jgi:hypothetical protein
MWHEKLAPPALGHAVSLRDFRASRQARPTGRGARLAEEIEAATRELGRKRAAVTNLDAEIPLFDTTDDPPLIRAIMPRRRGKWFRFAEQTRLAPEAVRNAPEPLSVLDVMEHAVAVKWLSRTDPAFRVMLERQTRRVLTGLTLRDVTFRFETKPVTWSLVRVRGGRITAEPGCGGSWWGSGTEATHCY